MMILLPFKKDQKAFVSATLGLKDHLSIEAFEKRQYLTS